MRTEELSLFHVTGRVVGFDAVRHVDVLIVFDVLPEVDHTGDVSK